MKLNQSEKEALENIVANGAWPAVMAAARISLGNLQERLLNADNEDLVVAKAQYDGAKTVIRALGNVDELFKEQEQKAKRSASKKERK